MNRHERRKAETSVRKVPPETFACNGCGMACRSRKVDNTVFVLHPLPQCETFRTMPIPGWMRREVASS